MAADAERDVERLYGLPQGDFTAARDATARRLRAAGEREAATTVAALRRPTVAAALVNRLVRDEPAGMRELAAVADDLEAAVAAGDPNAMRAAAGRERSAVDALVAAARDADEALAPATLQRLRETLHAAAIDEEARAEVLSGRLTKERVAAGLGPAPGPGTRPRQAPAAPAKEPPAPAPAPAPKRAEPDRAAERRRELAERRERVATARAARDEVRETERAARAEAKAAETELGAAQARLDRARAAHDEARTRLDEAEAALEAARGS